MIIKLGLFVLSNPVGSDIPTVDGKKTTFGSDIPNLVMTNIAMVKPWPIEIDGLPNLKMLDLSMAMLVITRWYPTWLSNMVPKECPSIYGGFVLGKSSIKTIWL